MKKRKLQIDVMGLEPNFQHIRQDELIRCKLYIDGIACMFWTTRSNYEHLMYYKFFIRDGKTEDVSGAINTTNMFTEE
jgi:hypothetical protein